MINLDKFPRFPLAHLPTPFEAWENLGTELGLANLYAKRDDCTGFAGGGNKSRKLEFLMGEALAQDADTILTVGATQSNHCRQAAAAAQKAGLDPQIVLVHQVAIEDASYKKGGNVLLGHLLDATIYNVDAPDKAPAFIMQLIEEMTQAGRNVYFMPPGGSTPVGCLGYVACALEMKAQADAQNIVLDHVVLANSSAGTHAGLLAGFAALGMSTKIHGINVYNSDPAKTFEETTELTKQTLALIGAPDAYFEVEVHPEYLGDGYGIPSGECLQAIQMAAQTEAVFLDPVYTGKAMAGLVAMVRAGAFAESETVTFLHTGGMPGLLAYSDVFEFV